MKIPSYYESLKAIINEEDPLGLIDTDTPESFNEYDSEVREILQKDVTLLTQDALATWIRDVFISSFNEDIARDRSKYDNIAEKFISAIKKSKA